MKIYLPYHAIPFIFFILTVLFFFSQRNEKIYQHSLGLITKNWTVVDGQKTLQDVPFHAIDDSTVVRWDAEHYLLISESGYDVSRAGSDFIYAFFPAFPAFWRIFRVSPTWMPIVNYFIFLLGLLLLFDLFVKKIQHTMMWIVMTLPSVVIFMLPYTESLFFLLISIGLWGLLRKRTSVYFVAMLLAALTRPSFTILGLALICNEILNLARHRDLKRFAISSFKMISPLLLGTLLVGLIQYLQGSGELFAFMRVQEYWGHKLGLPTKLTDWSHQGFDLNVAILFVMFIPISFILLRILKDQLRFKRESKTDQSEGIINLRNLSLIYIFGTVLFVLLFRGGSLHCLFRFVLCSPFAYVLLFNLSTFSYTSRTLNVIIGVLSLLSFLTLMFVEYGRGWNFSDLGFFILISGFFLMINSEKRDKLWYRVQLVCTLGLNVIWTAWMFNSYLGDCWIFA